MGDSKGYEWVEFYEELANKLLDFKDDRTELIKLVPEIFKEAKIEPPQLESEEYAVRGEVVDIDPFTFFVIFNRGISDENRIKILSVVKKRLEIENDVPKSFEGVPVANNYQKTYYPFLNTNGTRDSKDKDSGMNNINNLWELFDSALEYDSKKTPENKEKVEELFDKCLDQKEVGIFMLTAGLFWIAPKTFLCLDKNSQEYIWESELIPQEVVKNLPDIPKKKEDFNGENYLTIVDEIEKYLNDGNSKLRSFVELSDAAYNCKDKKSNNDNEKSENGNEEVEEVKDIVKTYADILKNSKNVIFRGAPGTGKTYLAKQIAAWLVGKKSNYSDLNDEQKEQVEFVQFHPSYDYSDFVEGIRPKVNNEDESIAFELRDGIFKEFVERARKNYEDSKKDSAELTKESNIEKVVNDFLNDAMEEEECFETKNGTKSYIDEVNDKDIYIKIPENNKSKKVTIKQKDIIDILKSEKEIGIVGDVRDFFGKKHNTQAHSYIFSICEKIKPKLKNSSKNSNNDQTKIEEKDYIFIIDEINRGEISKILGELFFSIDPGYRGVDGSVSTQYSNMHDDPNEKFFIPDNVYIIGTMNDIDRSVDSFDFAMRRRFRFIEITAESTMDMLDTLDEKIVEEAKDKMRKLNEAIVEVEDLNSNYQIGGSYFLNLNKEGVGFEELWSDYLEPLLQEYVRGMYDEKDIMEKLEKAYNSDESSEGEADEANQDQ